MATARRKRRRRGSSGGPVPHRQAAARRAEQQRDAPASSAERRAAERRRAAARGERPPSPWGSFPASELMIGVGIVVFAAGMLVASHRQLLLAVGLLTASVGGAELALREHLAGYRSHTALLAGLPAVVVLAGLTLAEALTPGLRLAIAVVVFAAAAAAMMRIFRRASGGSLFRAGGLRNR